MVCIADSSCLGEGERSFLFVFPLFFVQKMSKTNWNISNIILNKYTESSYTDNLSLFSLLLNVPLDQAKQLVQWQILHDNYLLLLLENIPNQKKKYKPKNNYDR